MGKNLTVNNDTYATNPGNARLNPFVWFLHNMQTVSLLSVSLIGAVALAYYVSAWFIILILVALVVNGFYWIRQKEHFQSGDSNGGIVVSLKPPLVAVTTDLTKMFGEYPVVKIIRYRGVKEIQLGDRIPTVALYTSFLDERIPHWEDFDPRPLSYATLNKAVLQRAMDSYPKQQWKSLEKRLKEVPKPYAVGLYKVEVATSDWRNSPTLE